MKVKSLEKQLKSQAKELEDARARVAATDQDFERFRQQARKTPEGGLRQELFRLGAAKAEAEAQVTVRIFCLLSPLGHVADGSHVQVSKLVDSLVVDAVAHSVNNGYRCVAKRCCSAVRASHVHIVPIPP